MDDKCPWCGEVITDPFTGREVTTPHGWDRAIEAHAEECDVFLAEQAEA